jgi:enoyl-CoA hydratase
MSEGEIRCERQGSAGLITLDRPKALNALTLAMVREMRRALDAWETDPRVTRVVITGTGEKAFCAGGDIRRLYELGKAGRHAEALTFWREEYELNIRIKRFTKPYVALIDGIVMGGGVGVSLHGSHRVLGERAVFAMPEVGVGFFPDVGATYALPRLPDRTGWYLALTGERVRAPDMMALGLGTHAVGSTSVPGLVDALTTDVPIEGVLESTRIDPGPASLEAHRPAIARCFCAESVPAILDRLDAEGTGFAQRTAATMRTKSPTSLVIALEQMRRGGALSFEEALRTEFRIVSRLCRGHDFYEGVRAVIMDKDGTPKWRPARLDEVAPETIAAHFASLGRDELAAP